MIPVSVLRTSLSQIRDALDTMIGALEPGDAPKDFEDSKKSTPSKTEDDDDTWENLATLPPGEGLIPVWRRNSKGSLTGRINGHNCTVYPAPFQNSRDDHYHALINVSGEPKPRFLTGFDSELQAQLEITMVGKRIGRTTRYLPSKADRDMK